jgi:outer membrane protein
MTRRLLAASFLLGLAASPAHAQDIKLGFVDLQRAISETEDGRKARADLKKIFDQKQKELDEQQANLRKEAEDLDKKRTLLPAEKVREREQALSSQLQKVQGTYVRHQQDLQQREQEAMGKIIDRMQAIIGRIATNDNLTMVFDRQQSGLIFAKPHLDLTNEVIRRYNAGEGAGAGGAKKAGAPGAPAAPAGAAPAAKPKK